ncbi:SAM-dependent methyltransferase [Massilia sp. Root351]|uniref:class I SAM-dependent methyltransferase n=1 Tax=Massilia sp. Root351 TaxID=1736522 RepID=UPI00070A7700|nr:methyltransferase domain-containing protein [Massilia sp. Root351]KQV80224.1 SAM-dependent methyltransferase [Massilia sp. Root351]
MSANPATFASPQAPAQPLLLHVGCGHARPERLPAYFRERQWREIRLDIDPGVQPDIVGSIADLSAIPSAGVDAIWCSHSLEHLPSFEVPAALEAFRRVLKADGFALISVPDLRAVARHIVEGDLQQPLYHAAAGPISALDILFGHQASIRKGNQYMAHRTGFTSDTLGGALAEAGFDEVRVHEGTHWDLWAVATMPRTPGELFNQLAGVVR